MRLEVARSIQANPVLHSAFEEYVESKKQSYTDADWRKLLAATMARDKSCPNEERAVMIYEAFNDYEHLLGRDRIRDGTLKDLRNLEEEYYGLLKNRVLGRFAACLEGKVTEEDMYGGIPGAGIEDRTCYCDVLNRRYSGIYIDYMYVYGKELSEDI